MSFRPVRLARGLHRVVLIAADRFGSPNVTPNDLARADAWADAAISALLPRVYRGFGAIHLMVRFFQKARTEHKLT